MATQIAFAILLIVTMFCVAIGLWYSISSAKEKVGAAVLWHSAAAMGILIMVLVIHWSPNGL